VSADGVHQAWTQPWARRSGAAHPVLGWRRPALWLPLGIALALGAVLAWSPAMAARATRENGVVENLQVLLLLGAAAFALRRRVARPRAPDAAFALLFLGMVVREIHFQRWVIGRPWGLVADLIVPAPPPMVRTVLFALTLGLIAAVGAYCALRLRECVTEGRRVLFEPWGQLMLVATAVLGLTELFERPLGRLSCCPRDFLEEGLELIGSLWLLLAMRARALGVREMDR
jgi:hypothetical protein